MHITRVAVTLALGASTANALPWSKPLGGSANAPNLNADNLDTTRHVHSKESSPDSMRPYMKVGISSNQPHEFADNSQLIQKEMTKEDLSLDASQEISLGHDHDIRAGLTGATFADKQSEEMIDLTRAQGSVASYGSNNMLAVQQDAMEVQHRGSAKGASRPENNINFAVKAGGVFSSFGQAWDQRAKLGHGEQQQETTEHMGNTRLDRSEMFMPTDKAYLVDDQTQQVANSMPRVEKVREVRNHENCNQMPDNKSAEAHAQQHSAMHQNHNYARSHMDGSDVQADETEHMNSQHDLDRVQHQEQMNRRGAKYSHQQQQTQQQMPEQMPEHMLQQKQEQVNEQMQQQIREHMQPLSGVTEDVQSAMDNFHR
jgi:hypothetical protein